MENIGLEPTTSCVPRMKRPFYQLGYIILSVDISAFASVLLIGKNIIILLVVQFGQQLDNKFMAHF